MKSKLTVRQIVSVFFISTTLLLWSLPYLANTFYEQFLEAYHLTNTQAGFLLTMFGLTATPGYIIGGIIADRVRAKLLLLLSLFSSCALAVAMAFVTGYAPLLIIFGLFGVTIPMLQWSAYLKMVRAQGSEDQQGRIFSWLEIFGAIIPAIGSYGILAFMKTIIATVGFKWVTVIYGAILAVFGLLILFFVKEPESITQENSFKLAYIGKVLKEPAVWLNCLIVLGLYTSPGIITYLNPYMTQFFGISTTLAVAIMAGSKTLLRLFCAPIGGRLIDKTGRSSVPLKLCSIICIAILIAMLLVPSGAQNGWLMVSLVVLLCIMIPLGRPAMYTPVPEAGIPMMLTGTAMGLVSGIGYSTDIWLYSLCGNWIDKHGEQGYRYILILFIASLVLVFVSAVAFDFYMKKKRAAAAEK